MALRMLEVTVPEDRLERIPELVEDFSLIQYWVSQVADGVGEGRFLLDAADAEALTDRLVSRFGSDEGFRLILLPVEATLPLGEAEAELPEETGEAAEKGPASPRRISREELYEDVRQASRVTPVYLVLVALSSVVAAVGLIRGDVAIIIGAMVIAPLLGPNIALALASTLGDPDLARTSLRSLGVGVLSAAALSFLVGLALKVDPSSPELAARTGAGLGDIVIALAAGTAGSLAFTTGIPSALVGVMVAVALLPPLVAAGLLLGAGYGTAALGAVMLLLTNVICVNLAAVATFLAQRVRPRTWWEAHRAKRATRLAVAAWVVMLAVLTGLLLLWNLRGV